MFLCFVTYFSSPLPTMYNSKLSFIFVTSSHAFVKIGRFFSRDNLPTNNTLLKNLLCFIFPRTPVSTWFTYIDIGTPFLFSYKDPIPSLFTVNIFDTLLPINSLNGSSELCVKNISFIFTSFLILKYSFNLFTITTK